MRRVARMQADALANEADKEILRAFAERSGEGFTEETPGVGSVQVTAGAEKKFKGLMPVMDPAKFLALPKGRQLRLQDDGLVKLVQEYTRGAKPSVVVRL